MGAKICPAHRTRFTNWVFRVLKPVLRGCYNLKIFKTVIPLVAVFMVNIFKPS